MKVELLSYTPDALNLLLKTKNTRLRFDSDPSTWSEEQRAEHLAYMRDTIQSSWEFVDYTFSISGVSRAFTHQLVRTRTGSYAQESQRAVDVRDAHWVLPGWSDPEANEEFDSSVHDSLESYAKMVDKGMPVHDARGVLPTNICTSIIAKFNLRTLSNMAEKRLCVRTQGEYQQVFREMKRLVVEVHPWADDFINVHCVQHGTCCFPRFTSCPYQVLTVPKLFLDTARRNLRKAMEGEGVIEAGIKVKDGASVTTSVHHHDQEKKS